MKVKNGENGLPKSNSGKNGISLEKIPILKLPKNNDIFMCSMLNPNNQTIENCFINKNSIVLERNTIDNWPVEKCIKCQCELSIDNLSFIVDNEIAILYCHECCQDKGKNIELSFSAQNSSQKYQLINELKAYLEKHKNESNVLCIKMMNKLISLFKIIFYLFEAFKFETAFINYTLYLESYIKSLSVYIEIVNECNMENLYLFLKNLFVISAIKYDKSSLKGISKYYLKNIDCFNVSGIMSLFLEKIFEESEDDMFMLKEVIELKRGKAISELEREIYRANKDLSSIIFDLGKYKISWLKKRMRIIELKEQITDFLRNYNYSYNYISSKKVLERKFINEIIYIIFKYHYKRFETIKEDDYIVNSIQKELQNIIRFLGGSNESIKQKLIEKLNKEVKNLENNKKQKKWNIKRNTSTNNIKNNEISLTEEEKTLLSNYLSSNIDESYNRIYASKFSDSEGINYKKIQVILEFLFFIRDKTITIIHLLNEASTLFFEFLNQNSTNKIDKDNINETDENNIIENYCNEEKDDDIIEELSKDFNLNFSKQYKEKNKELIKNISVEAKDKINCRSALNYIFSSNPKNNFAKEIEYLYENIVLPQRSYVKVSNEELKGQDYSYYSLIKNNIDSLYTKINNKFIDDPLYNKIVNYLTDSFKKMNDNKCQITPKIIDFYEKNVENFLNFKEIFFMKKKVDEYLNIIESDNKTLEKMELVKEKYILIKKEIEEYLKPNQENYKKYYEEWKAKNTQFVVKNYELNELFKDLNLLIPINETMDVAGRDKRNFYLVLYLFQKNYFLKDYI